MTAWRLVGLEVFFAVTLVVLAAAGLLGLGSTVESGGLEAGSAVLRGLLLVPTFLAPLGPLLVVVGVALAVARMEARGERLALEASGLGPWRTAPAVLLVGLGVGLAQWTLAGVVAPRTLVMAEALSGEAAPSFLWLEGTAVRVEDGARWQLEGGRLVALEPLELAPEVVARARMLQQPRRATHAVLSGATGAPAVVERQARAARGVACGLLAVLCWVPRGRLPWGDRFTLAGLLCLLWSALDLALQGLATQGHLPPGPAAWSATILAALALGGLALAGLAPGRQLRG